VPATPRQNRLVVIGAAVLAALGVLALALVLTSGGDDDDAAPASGPGEIFLEPAGQVGPAPFTKDVSRAPRGGKATGVAPTTTAATGNTTVATGAVVLTASSGATPGLYGGTMDDSACDPAQMVAFLEDPANADKAAAWAAVLGIDVAGIREYVSHLTPVVLTRDTRVTNHGFAGGRATPRQSVFQAGTAVLVDDHGTPRVRCRCGNPLLEPVAASTTPKYLGTDWDGFDPATIVVVSPSPQPVTVLVLVDVDTGARFERPVGTAGEADVAAPDTTSTTAAAPTTAAPAPTRATAPATAATTAAPATTRPPATTTTAPSTTAAPTTTTLVQVTPEGSLSASSEFPNGQFPAALALDGDPTTSWFSAGDAEGPTSSLTWTHRSDDFITEVRIVGNAANANPQFRRNFGFRSLTVRVLDANGGVVFTEDRDLPGTPDPDVVVTPNTRGRTVEVVFNGHESPACGGIAELTVTASR
jgi:hypothetical protein